MTGTNVDGIVPIVFQRNNDAAGTDAATMYPPPQVDAAGIRPRSPRRIRGGFKKHWQVRGWNICLTKCLSVPYSTCAPVNLQARKLRQQALVTETTGVGD